LEIPSMMVLHAARAASIQAIGFIGSIANLGDVAEFERKLARAKALGFRGAIVVHPKFLDAINNCYRISAAEFSEAESVVREFDAAFSRGVGAFKLGDKMIDKPIYLRALRLLQEGRVN